MPDIPTTEPQEIRAGDTIKWRREDLSSNYPASSWTLKYYFLKTGKQIIITTSADGEYFSIVVSKTTSAAYPSGVYSWLAKVSKGTEEFTVDEGTIQILPDLVAAATGYDSRSHVKKVLDAIEAAVEGRATRTDLAYTIQGRSISHIPPAELIKWHSHYKQLYKSEQDAEKIKNGLGRRKILTRFV